MTISGGQVIIHNTPPVGGVMGTYHGTVNAEGEVVTVHRNIPNRTVSGTIHGNVFTGQRLVAGGNCQYTVEMNKQ
jgi:hypothetical protein